MWECMAHALQHGFDKSAADTPCRQIGYTNAKNFNTLLHTTKLRPFGMPD